MKEALIYQQYHRSDNFPDLVTDSKPVSYFEFWPTWLFYTPMKLYGLWLSLRYGGLTLPTITDPLFDAGGFVGESKSQILEQIPESLSDYTCPHIAIVKEADDEVSIERAYNQALEGIEKKNIGFKCVIKPDIGERGIGVQIAYTKEDIKNYIQSYPVGEKIVIQKIADYPHEAGLFYIRHPDQEEGQIFSLTLKYFPYVVGDGKSTLEELILADPRAGILSHIYLPRHKENLDMVLAEGQEYRIAFAGSHSRGTIFKNGNPFITDKMTKNWDKLCKEIPEFYFGRFDVRFNSLDDLENLNNIKIIEINGASAEATHIWDSHTSLREAYSVLMKQYKHMVEIGYKNKKRGFKPMKLREVLKLINKNKELSAIYPHTH